MLVKEKISDDIYIFSKYLENVGITVNSYLVLDDKISLVETGTESFGREVIPELEKIVDLSEISYIFVTHEHLDHIGGLPEIISEAYNAKIVAHELVNVHIAFLGVYGRTHVVTGGESIPIGSRYIRIHYAPVETKGYIYFELLPDNIIFSGDVFGQLSLERHEVISTIDNESLIRNIMDFHAGLRYNTEDIRKYFGELEKRKVNIIAPSHGSVIKDRAEDILRMVLSKRLERKESIWRKIFRF